MTKPAASGRYLALSSASDLITTAVAFATGLLVARVLGPHDRGLYSLITTVGAVVSFIAGMGLFESILAAGRIPRTLDYATAALAGILGTLVIAGVAISRHEPLFFTYAAAPVLWGLMQISLARSAIQQNTAWLVLRVLPSAIQLVIVGVVLVLGRFSVAAALVAFLVGYVLTLLTDRLWQGAPERSAADLKMTDVVTQALRQHSLNVPRMLNYRGPIIVLGLLSTPREVGYFAVASSVGSLVPALSWSLTQNLLVQTTRGDGSAAAMRRRMIAAAYLTSCVSAIAAIVFGSWILRVVYGAQYSGVWLAFALIMAVQGPWVHAGLLETAFRAANRAAWAAWVEIAGIAATVVTMIMSASAGYMSAAYGTAMGCVVVLVSCMITMRRNEHVFVPSVKE